MRRLFGLVVVVVIVLAVVGYFRGWWNLSTSHDNANTHIDVTVNHDKVKQDAHEAENKVKQGAEKLKQKIDH